MTFIEAIQTGNIEEVKSALKENTELVNSKTEQGISVLLLAMYYQKYDIIKVLLDYKTDFDWFEAATVGKVETLEKHLEDNPEILNQYAVDGFTALGLACFFGKEKVVKYLLEKGADPNIASNNDMKVAPLHSATAVKRLDIVEMLIKQNADVNAAQGSGVTALHSAAHNGAVDIVRLLLTNGADKEAKMSDGKTPMDFAIADDFTEIVKLLKN